MSQTANTFGYCLISDNSKVGITDGGDTTDMTKAERKEVLLEFMAEHQLALPPSAIYRNLRLHKQITFSERSVENYLDEFVDEGLIARIAPGALKDRNVKEITDRSQRAYYIITDEGIESAEQFR